MSNVTIVTNNDNRPRNIAIGFVVLAVLTYWHFTGSLPFLASTMVPQPEDGKLSSAWSFGVELLGDVLYFVGVAATGLASGIGTMMVGLIRLVIGRVNGTPTQPTADGATVTKDLLDKRTTQVFKAIQKPLNDLSEQVKLMQDQLDVLSNPSVVKPSIPRRKATTMPKRRTPR